MTPESSSLPTSPRVPKVGDEVRYKGQPATVIRVYPAGASWMPTKSKPVDLRAGREDYTMIGHGLSQGWCWPEEMPDDLAQGDDAR